MANIEELEKLLEEIIASDSYESARKAKELQERWSASLDTSGLWRLEEEPEQDPRKSE